MPSHLQFFSAKARADIVQLKEKDFSDHIVSDLQTLSTKTRAEYFQLKHRLNLAVVL